MAYYVSYKNKSVQNWTNQDVADWIQTIGLSDKWKNTMLSTIKSTGCSGNDWCGIKSDKDLAKSLGIRSPMLANRVYREFERLYEEKQKIAALIALQHKKSNSNAKEFKLNLFAQSKLWDFSEMVSQQTTAKYIKQLFKRECSNSYSHTCWCGMILLPGGGRMRTMRDNETLSSVGITNEKHLITGKFRATGGGLQYVWYDNGALFVQGPQKQLVLPTFHISCKSDKMKGQDMIGFVLYLCDNKQLFYLNGMKCKSGYILLTSSDKLININTKQGTMHSKAFKYFTGKDLNDMNIIGGGFAIRNGIVLFRSYTFNAATDKFHDGKKEMHALEQECIRVAVDNWKNNVQNTSVADVFKGRWSYCPTHGFIKYE